jgi:hypothetical protein
MTDRSQPPEARSTPPSPASHRWFRFRDDPIAGHRSQGLDVTCEFPSARGPGVGGGLAWKRWNPVLQPKR